MKQLLLFVFFSGTAFPACIPVSGSRILGRDLALADSRYAALPATLVAAFNAEPGRIRIVTATELQRLARANDVHIDSPTDLCFEFPVRQLTKDDAIEAMRRVLPADAALEVLEIQSTPMPEGTLEFPREGPDAAGVWRGCVKYAESSRVPFWARVTLTVKYTVVVAASDLAADMAIPASALRLEQKTGPLRHETSASRIADVAGRAPKHALKAGAVIPAQLLTDPPAVHRGDQIRVEVRSGPARLHFDATADAPARLGAIVELRNPLNGKAFKARLDSPATATVEVNGSETEKGDPDKGHP